MVTHATSYYKVKVKNHASENWVSENQISGNLFCGGTTVLLSYIQTSRCLQHVVIYVAYLIWHFAVYFGCLV